jgi:hypothetical protein
MHLRALIATLISDTSVIGLLRPLALILVVTCYIRRNEDIGGWLMFFYYQIYGSLVLFAVQVAQFSDPYRLSYWDEEVDHIIFLAAVLPKILGFLLVAAVGTILLRRREWYWLRHLQFVLLVAMLMMLLPLALDALYFRESLVWNSVRLVMLGAWLAYFMSSERVKRVFPRLRPERVYNPTDTVGPFR